MSLPEFKTPSYQAEWNKHIKRFSLELIRCTNRDNRISIPSKLNVLLFITDRKNSKQMKSWDGVQTFLKISGYDVERVKATWPREADLLFICTDREDDEDVKYLVRIISQGLLGLEPKHEILVSSPVRRYVNPYGGPSHRPMTVDSDFMIYGVCMIHEYIRTLYDDSAKIGRHIAMMLQLEDILQQAGVVQASEDTVAFDKIEAFKSLLKSRKHDGGEARWVFAVLDLLRHTRNILGHIPPPQKAMKGCNKAEVEINYLANEYRRGMFGTPPKSDIQDLYSSHKKWMTSLAQITSHWIVKYLRDNPV